MFKNNSNGVAKNGEADASSRNLIASGTMIKGEIQSDGNIRIDGSVEGTLQCKGKVVVGPTGKIEGDIVCQNANISGEIRAKLNVSELLTLQTTARLYGDITTGKLAIEPGAVFTGTCQMGLPPSKEKLNGAEKRKEYVTAA